MGLTEGHQAKTVWENPAEIVRSLKPENPVMVFAPTVLQDRARAFLAGFPGLVTYAVKSNPDEAVIQNLVQAGVRGFDVASPFEIDLIGRIAPRAARHYHNPVRAGHEIGHAVTEQTPTPTHFHTLGFQLHLSFGRQTAIQTSLIIGFLYYLSPRHN